MQAAFSADNSNFDECFIAIFGIIGSVFIYSYSYIFFLFLILHLDSSSIYSELCISCM